LGAWLLKNLHAPREQNLNAVIAGAVYSRDLDFWGVELQRAGELEKAAACFENAQKFNPDNQVAQINLDFNKKLRAGEKMAVDLSKTTADQFGKFSTLNDVLNADGPFDEPSFCFEMVSSWRRTTDSTGKPSLTSPASAASIRTICPPECGSDGFTSCRTCPGLRWMSCASRLPIQTNSRSTRRMKPS